MTRRPKTDLSPAECAVARLVLDGLSNKEIASSLGRSDLTVKAHVAAILRKAQAPSRGRFIASVYRGALREAMDGRRWPNWLPVDVGGPAK